MKRRMCVNCPYGPNSKFEDAEQRMLLIDLEIDQRKLPRQPHGCHMATTEMITNDVSLQCAGHALRLKSQENQ